MALWRRQRDSSRARRVADPDSAATAAALILDPTRRPRVRWLWWLGRIGLRDVDSQRSAAISSEASTAEPSRSPSHAGRPTQLFFGYLPGVSKRDATQYAIGVAHRNAINVVNAVYGVFSWEGGWAYEVHEGGSKLALLPAILKYFDRESSADLDTLAVHLQTAQRAVKVQRTRTGVAAFLMPEGFSAAQTPGLESSGALAPAIPLRTGVTAVGMVLFGTGFLAMMIVLWKRPDPPPLPNTDHDPIRYERLPISQWPALLSAAAAGYVDSLEYSGGQWKINRGTSGSSPASSSTSAPSLNTPTPTITP
jgi:hypothetical protein